MRNSVCCDAVAVGASGSRRRRLQQDVQTIQCVTKDVAGDPVCGTTHAFVADAGGRYEGQVDAAVAGRDELRGDCPLSDIGILP